MVHKFDDFTLLPCVCYLPPENSSRFFDSNHFFECLLTDIYSFQGCGMIYICGDFNSRCGNLDDFITGVDDIVPRHIVDFSCNSYGEQFIDFLINANMCMLNGRSDASNEFTSVSAKGSSVVDYCVVSHDDLYKITDFKITLTSDVINKADIVHSLIPTCIPDHSLLSWNIVTDLTEPVETVNSSRNPWFDRFDLSKVNDSFLNGHASLIQVNAFIEKLEQRQQCQNDIDIIYEEWCAFVKENMYNDIPYKSVHHGASKKKYRRSKPWWNADLSLIWWNLCRAERDWLNCSGGNLKSELNAVYVQIRRKFDRKVQRTKRAYWYTMQDELLNACNANQSDFWRSIGKLGVGQGKSSRIPMEVVLENGSTSSNVTDILNKWKHDFSSLYNNTKGDDTASNTHYGNGMVNTPYNVRISIVEVRKAIIDAKRGKASGIDEIPSEVLKNDATILFLHALYNHCFDTGIVPSVWNKCIINPIPKCATSDPRDPLSYRGISLACTMYKIYSKILNDRLSTWAESNNILSDEQNGFRKKRSTVDHICSLVNLIETRKKQKQSTFAAFIDFRKAYDFINRTKLWNR